MARGGVIHQCFFTRPTGNRSDIIFLQIQRDTWYPQTLVKCTNTGSYFSSQILFRFNRGAQAELCRQPGEFGPGCILLKTR